MAWETAWCGFEYGVNMFSISQSLPLHFVWILAGILNISAKLDLSSFITGFLVPSGGSKNSGISVELESGTKPMKTKAELERARGIYIYI